MKLDVERINKARRRYGAEPLPVRGRGRPPIGEAPKAGELIELYQRQGLSIRAAADVLGVSKDAVARALAALKIKRRPRVKPSRLAVYGFRKLRQRVGADGLTATARALGVSAPALADYLRRHGPKK
jgi:predicted transcriptional regulator